jgi:essential nuclear protein 1
MPKIKKPIRSSALSTNMAATGGVVGGPSGHEPLGQVIADDTNRQKFAKASKRHNRPTSDDKDDGATQETPSFLDAKSSRKIMELSKAQQIEVETEEIVQQRRQRLVQTSKNQHNDSDDEGDDDDDNVGMHNRDDDDDDEQLVQHTDEGYVTISDGIMGLSPEDEALVASMMTGATEERKTLADLILEKIEKKDNGQQQDNDDEDDDGREHEQQLPPKVVEVYTDIGKVLSRYTAGKLPKAFKVIPSLSNWEEILYLTRPDQWTPQAMYAATRIFASNLNPKMAQKFYNLVLLDSVRSDIHSNKKLNYHYYMALKKSVYKPAAFFRGVLLPLCTDNCTLREAAIVASVLQRVSIPVHHSAVAIHKLAQLQEYNGASSIFIKTLLNKKYSLPSPVISSLIQHFTSFMNREDSLILPVLWHQSLLVFVQRYKDELIDSREIFRKLLKIHFHAKITPEIRRELFGAQAYKDERQQVMMTTASVGSDYPMESENTNMMVEDDE